MDDDTYRVMDLKALRCLWALGRRGSLTGAGVDFRGDIVEGRGGRQIIVDDPAGNPIELFEPKPA